jgi:putative transport protein
MNPKLAGSTLGVASTQDWTRGVYLRSVSRGGQEVPVAAGVVLQRGDVLRLVGPEPVVQRAATNVGAIVAPDDNIDFVVLGLAILRRHKKHSEATAPQSSVCAPSASGIA